MGNQGSTFGKRQREQNRKDKARAKQERLAARRSDTPRTEKGPPIASFAEAHAAITAGPSAPEHSMSPGPIAGPSTANRDAPGGAPAPVARRTGPTIVGPAPAPAPVAAPVAAPPAPAPAAAPTPVRAPAPARSSTTPRRR